MSLIQEALRRQQEENASRQGGSATPPPPPPPPEPSPAEATPPEPTPVKAEETSAPPPPLKPLFSRRRTEPPMPAAEAPPPPPPPPAPSPAEEEPEPEPDSELAPEALGMKPRRTAVRRPPSEKTRALPTLIGVVVVILLLLGAVVWMVQLAVRHWKKTQARPAPAMAQSTDIPAESAEPEPSAPPAALTVSKPAKEPAAPPIVPAPRVEPAPAPVRAPQARREPVQWPALQLSGVVGRGANGSAIINGEVLAVDEWIADARVVEVQAQGVVLEYKGDRRFVKVGGSLP